MLSALLGIAIVDIIAIVVLMPLGMHAALEWTQPESSQRTAGLMIGTTIGLTSTSSAAVAALYARKLILIIMVSLPLPAVFQSLVTATVLMGILVEVCGARATCCYRLTVQRFAEHRTMAVPHRGLRHRHTARLLIVLGVLVCRPYAAEHCCHAR